MKPSHLVCVVSLLALASVALNAQVARQENVVPLKNWAAPLYWQPNQTERITPQLQFSANAVSTNALTFIAITPCRLVDTRGAAANFNGISPFSGPSISAGGTITIPVQSATEASTDTEPAPCGAIPSIAQAYSFNLTVVPVAGGAVDFVSMWPSGYTKPFVATLNDPQGAVVANAAIVPAGTVSGGISVYNQGPATANVIIDMNGYFAAPTDLNDNTALGISTLASNATGQYNTANGYAALTSNTTGSYNMASGLEALFFNTTGGDNTASGSYALTNNTTGGDNTATGYSALFSNTVGDYNTANGYAALYSNTTGYYNTASGLQALYLNTTGQYNTANGSYALQFATTGNDNTASGAYALNNNTMGGDNTAGGYGALFSNTTGDYNTASGYAALYSNTVGFYNTATGLEALYLNTTGSDNTANGYNALYNNTTGSNNTADGVEALQNNTTGNNNIALGFGAGLSAPVGSSNSIYIGNQGASTDNAVIKIGSIGTQTSIRVYGAYGVTTAFNNGIPVLIDSDGQLGTMSSSRRFKEDIHDMGEASSALMRLRPVTFRYKQPYQDGSKPVDYGLIAEEVAQIYPDLAAKGSDGQIETVQYQKLTPMLLNELQKQNQEIETQRETIRLQNDRIAQQEARLAAVEALLSAADRKEQ